MLPINEVKLSGHIVQTPEWDGDVTLKVLLAHQNRVMRQDQEPLEITVFVELEIGGPRAPDFAEHVRPQTPIFIQGELHQETWTDGQGNERTKNKVHVVDWQFLLPQLKIDENLDPVLPSTIEGDEEETTKKRKT